MLNYSISFKNPLSQLVDIELELPTGGKAATEIKLPNWRPGRYQIQNFAKRIKSLKAFDLEENELKVVKTNKSTWSILCNGKGKIRVKYQYHAAAMDAGNSWLDDEQLYLNFINCMLYSDDYLNDTILVNFVLPHTYKIACGLEKVSPTTLKSPSFYRLVDSPMFASANLRQITFENSGATFHLWLQGDLEMSDDELIKDFDAYTTKQIEVMGDFPCEEYHYLFQILPYKHYHGVEHWNSTVITLGPSEEISKREGYLNLLGVSSHELFHTWNVIRLRPTEMTPYNFESENYHFTGFITEGVTTYYGDLFLARSGVFSLEEYLTELNKLLKRHYENEGRYNMSVADSSYDLWLDGYEKGLPGRKVSIYNEGALAALILDLLIRYKWKNKRSLDDVMRLMWERHGKDQSGYTSEDYREVAESVYGESLITYFDSILYGTVPYETYLNELFEAFGLNFNLNNAEKPEERQFGFRIVNGRVIEIASDSPSAKTLMLGDQITEVNGSKLEEAKFNSDSLNMKILRYGRSLEVSILTDKKQYFSIYNLSHKGVNELQRGWLEECLA